MCCLKLLIDVLFKPIDRCVRWQANSEYADYIFNSYCKSILQINNGRILLNGNGHVFSLAIDVTL